jgi:hypothetical protein
MKNVTNPVLAGAVCALALAIPAAAGDKAIAAKTQSAWPPETLSGTITMVDRAQKLLVVQDPDKVTFDMVVTPKTHIKSGNESLTLQDLSRYQNQNVSIKFVPERRGDVAESIRIKG